MASTGNLSLGKTSLYLCETALFTHAAHKLHQKSDASFLDKRDVIGNYQMAHWNKHRNLPPVSSTVPDLFLLGVPKAGTTSLAEMLRQSGRFCFGRSKESGILTSSYSIPARKRLYSDHYEGCDLIAQSVLDASPWYGYRSDLPELLDQIGAGDAAMMLSLRSPLDRAKSMFRDQVRRGAERRTFQEAVRHEVRTLERPSLVGKRDYVRGSQYSPVVRNSIYASNGSPPIVVFMEFLDDEASGQLGWLEKSLATGQLRMPALNVGIDERTRGLAAMDHAVSIARWLPPGVRLFARRRGQKALRMYRASLGRTAIPSVETELTDPGLLRELHAVFRDDLQGLSSLAPKISCHDASFDRWLQMLGHGGKTDLNA